MIVALRILRCGYERLRISCHVRPLGVRSVLVMNLLVYAGRHGLPLFRFGYITLELGLPFVATAALAVLILRTVNFNPSLVPRSSRTASRRLMRILSDMCDVMCSWLASRHWRCINSFGIQLARLVTVAQSTDCRAMHFSQI